MKSEVVSMYSNTTLAYTVTIYTMTSDKIKGAVLFQRCCQTVNGRVDGTQLHVWIEQVRTYSMYGYGS